MGWSFDIYPKSKKNYIQRILDDYKNSGYQVLGSRQTKQGLYVALVTPKGHKFLMCGMIRMSERCFGIKEMEEEMGPSMSDCPSSLFKLLDPPRNEYAKEFRERCIENDNIVKARRKWSPKEDETITIYGDLYIVIRKEGKKFRVKSLKNGVIYTAGKSQMRQILKLDKPEIQSDTVEDNCIISF